MYFPHFPSQNSSVGDTRGTLVNNCLGLFWINKQSICRFLLVLENSICICHDSNKQDHLLTAGLMCVQVQCSAEVKEGAVEVTVSGLKVTDTDLYRCELEVFYPPPYLRLTGNGTLIHVLGETPTLTCRHTQACLPTELTHSLFTLSYFLFIHFLCPQTALTVLRQGLRDRLHTRVMKKRMRRVMRGWHQPAFLWLYW